MLEPARDKTTKVSDIYISFKSMTNIKAKQAKEIARGLIASNVHFLLVAKDSKNKLPIELIWY